LILQNLPSELTQVEFTKVLDSEGFNGLYDFVFLPTSFRTGRSSRYAIVNLLRHAHGLLLAAHFHGRKAWNVGNGVPECQVKWSLPRQGLTELLEHYRNDVLMHESVPDELRPALYCDGWRVPMPPPTKRIRVPQITVDAYSEASAETPSTCTPESQSEDASEHALQFELTSEWPTLEGSAHRKTRTPVNA